MRTFWLFLEIIKHVMYVSIHFYVVGLAKTKLYITIHESMRENLFLFLSLHPNNYTDRNSLLTRLMRKQFLRRQRRLKTLESCLICGVLRSGSQSPLGCFVAVSLGVTAPIKRGYCSSHHAPIVHSLLPDFVYLTRILILLHTQNRCFECLSRRKHQISS